MNPHTRNIYKLEYEYEYDGETFHGERFIAAQTMDIAMAAVRHSHDDLVYFDRVNVVMNNVEVL